MTRVQSGATYRSDESGTRMHFHSSALPPAAAMTLDQQVRGWEILLGPIQRGSSFWTVGAAGAAGIAVCIAADADAVAVAVAVQRLSSPSYRLEVYELLRQVLTSGLSKHLPFRRHHPLGRCTALRRRHQDIRNPFGQ